ncbi:MAG: DNA polymerase subunit beta [Cyanobacteria bacterium]|jgi:predicted nucleotidyltransferase|nr:DNA polymerase subunit beta [Cyanobacteria bacterium GSL.Bin1]
MIEIFLDDSSTVLTAKLSDRLGVSYETLSNFCRRWEIAELAFFGSILRDDFRPNSDVDILVTFTPNGDAKRNLFDLIKMQKQLEHLLHRNVDLTEKKAIKNPYLRAEILKNYQIFYVKT